MKKEISGPMSLVIIVIALALALGTGFYFVSRPQQEGPEALKMKRAMGRLK